MDASPYRGRLAHGVLASRTLDATRQAFRVAGILFFLAAASTVPMALRWYEMDGWHPVGVAVAAVASVAGGIAYSFVIPRLDDDRLASVAPWAGIAGNSGSIIVVIGCVYWVGPRGSFMLVYFVPMVLYLFMFFQRRFAIVSSVALLVLFAGTLGLLDQPFLPVFQWLSVAGMVVGTGVLVGGIAREIDDLNSNLEQRVAEQVDELERAGRLRRFLSPQVAEVVTSEGELLAPHRADIAAFFVDLRGFTHFTNSVSAERVMQVLDEYYACVGSILDEHGATIGGFDGDGVFAYLGDPVPHDDAAPDAIRMARDVAARLDVLTRTWSDDTASIGYGIGLSYGQATLGLVGFESRADYTPVGAVVNMAARLCADAKHGEILIDDALRRAAALGDVTCRGEIDLKGFGLTETFTVAH
jgi:class 3 adenylate cyclase